MNVIIKFLRFLGGGQVFGLAQLEQVFDQVPNLHAPTLMVAMAVHETLGVRNTAFEEVEAAITAEIDRLANAEKMTGDERVFAAGRVAELKSQIEEIERALGVAIEQNQLESQAAKDRTEKLGKLQRLLSEGTTAVDSDTSKE